MKRIHIPGSDMWTFPFAFGTGSLNRQNERQQLALLDHYLSAGGNLIDTASSYGRETDCDLNTTEQILGNYLKLNKCSEKIMISTKGGHPPIAAMNQSRLTERHLRADLDQSRRALRRARIDLFFLHRDSPDTPVERLIDLLEQLKSERLITRYGLANFQSERVAAACSYCQNKGYSGLAAVSNRWSLSRFNPAFAPDPTQTGMDGALYDLLLRQSIVAMPYSGLGKGYFANRAAGGGQLPEHMRQLYDNELNDRRLIALQTLSRERGLSITSLTLAYLMQQPFPVIPVLSFTSGAQIKEAMLAADIVLRPAELAVLGAGERF